MAHVQKSTRQAIGHLFDHYGRNADEEKYKHLYRKNDCIDPNRTHLNYNLAPQTGTQQERFAKRINEVYCLKRKDVNVMCSWVITASKNLKKSQQEDFFKETYKFLENRYGRENVISSYVPLDETTPHMHFAFIPVIFDKKKNRFKVSAKEVINKLELKGFHGDLEDCLKSKGIVCSILNDATREGNKSIEELKRGSAIQKLNTILEKQQEGSQRLERVKRD